MLNVNRRGTGRPLLLIHGLGGSWRSWDTVLPGLAASREVIAIDLPGHGATPAEPDSGTFDGLVRSVDDFLGEEDLVGVPVVGSSMGARLVLELARRGRVGASVALDPGGFWEAWERNYFYSTLAVSIRLLRRLKPSLPTLSRHVTTRTLLLAQLSAKPWALSADVVANELRSFAETDTFDALLRDLARGPRQEGPAAKASGPATIGWGGRDRLCPPRQAERARAAFPHAHFHWFKHSGHFPMWDQPREAVELILART
ncbi:alpha/beta fold hydrolase [Proteobacteria bacterium 005FR1]|nr:alpha/beta fold hydrolase [Proteobacteria bacterium 005FR1]